ncbi:MAG: hypothetical protein ACQEP1_01385 [Nanobdellota archaeon]
MLKKKIIKKEISLLHFLLLLTSKIFIGIGIGLIISSYVWIAQPVWYIFIILGGGVLFYTLHHLMMAEESKESELEKKVKRKSRKKKAKK